MEGVDYNVINIIKMAYIIERDITIDTFTGFVSMISNVIVCFILIYQFRQDLKNNKDGHKN